MFLRYQLITVSLSSASKANIAVEIICAVNMSTAYGISGECLFYFSLEELGQAVNSSSVKRETG
jgi:hypothetical protein